jgi:hypothetical protein
LSITLTPTLMLGASTIAMCLACSAISAFLRVAEPGRADHRLDAALATGRQVRERAFGAREIDQHVARCQPRTQVGLDLHAARLPEERCGVLADLPGDPRRRAHRPAAGRRREHGFDQHMPIGPTAPAMATRIGPGHQRDSSGG